MRSGADILRSRGGGGAQGRVVQEAKDGAGGALGAKVGGGEETGRIDGKANAEEGVELEGEVVAEIAEGADFALVRDDGVWDRLLGFVVEEFAEVEGSVR